MQITNTLENFPRAFGEGQSSLLKLDNTTIDT